VGLPDLQRSDRSEQYIFVNGRATGAALINYAVREAYHTLMPNNRHPSVFIFIRLHPTQVDVNVHPTKKEVRFRQPSSVRDSVMEGIRQALSVQGDLATLIKSSPTQKSGAETSSPVQVQLKIEDLPHADVFDYPGIRRIEPQAGEKIKGKKIEIAPDKSGPWTWCRVVGQIGGLYVVLETEDGYVIMDPHAAHERVLFDKFMNDLQHGKVQTQSLLIPETVELSPKDALRIRKALDIFREMGFGVSEFGGDTFVIDALPSCFAAASAASMIINITQTLEEAGTRSAKGRWREESIAQAAW